MFCSNCGKKVLDSMLYCPFCGTKLIIPDQDGDAAEERFSFDLPDASNDTPAEDASMAWAEPPKEEEPTPKPVEPESKIKLEKLASTTSERKRKLTMLEEEAGADPVEEPIEPKLVRKQRPAEDETPKKAAPIRRQRSERTAAKDEPISMSNLFMEDEDDDEDGDDAYDTYERAQRQRPTMSNNSARYEDKYNDDDEDDDEDDGFFLRHLRGIVALMLLLILLGGLAFYGMTESGQALLARVNYTLPFVKAESYSKLGFDAYQAARYADAAAYYERALERESNNYNYASSAANAYISAGNNEKATEMLKKCVGISPSSVEPYSYLLRLYPDASTRPEEITQLIEQGFLATGDPSLNLDR